MEQYYKTCIVPRVPFKIFHASASNFFSNLNENRFRQGHSSAMHRMFPPGSQLWTPSTITMFTYANFFDSTFFTRSNEHFVSFYVFKVCFEYFFEIYENRIRAPSCPAPRLSRCPTRPPALPSAYLLTAVTQKLRRHFFDFVCFYNEILIMFFSKFLLNF